MLYHPACQLGGNCATLLPSDSPCLVWWRRVLVVTIRATRCGSSNKQQLADILVQVQQKNNEPDLGESDDVSTLSNGRLCAGACEKILRRFAHRVGLFIKIILTSLVVCMHWGLSLAHHQRRPISTVVTSVETPYFTLHPLCPRPKPF